MEQLIMCTVKLRYKDKSVKCRFFVVQALAQQLGMPDMEVFGILIITCAVTDGLQADRKFNS